MNIDTAKRLADRRKRAGFSQEALALELGVSRQAVSKWERKHFHRENDDVHIGPDGIHIESNEKGDSVHVSWKDGIHVKDGSHGDEVHVGWDGIRVNDHHYDDWRDAHAHWDESKRKHPNPAWRSWNVFPYPLLAIIAYLAFGLMNGIPDAWFSGIGFFLSIPVYYALGGLLFGKRVCAFFSTLYSTITIEAFILLALDGCAHPGWIALVSIPFVVGLFNGIAHWWRTRKK